MPDDLVFGRILPALGVMLCLSTCYYAHLAYRLAKIPATAILRTKTLSEPRGFYKALIAADSDRILGFTASDPVPFVTMPLVFERAFGGSDHSDPSPRYQGSEVRNLVGVGFHKNSDASAIEGTPLPNLEDPRQRILSWSEASIHQRAV